MGQGSSEICCTHCPKDLQQSRSTEDAILGKVPLGLLEEKQDFKSSASSAALLPEKEAASSSLLISGLDGLKPASSRDEKTTLATENELNVEVKAVPNDNRVSDERTKQIEGGRNVESYQDGPASPHASAESGEASTASSPMRSRRKQTRTQSLKAALNRMLKSHANEASLQRSQFWNTNLPSDYSWLEVVLWVLGKNQASSLTCTDMANGRQFIPLFFVLGACPNTFCGMQAVMYSSSAINNSEIDFWWVKPTKTDSSRLESSTLCKHLKGQHKNDPGRSKSFYKPLADLFQGEGSTMNGVKFSIGHGTNGLKDPRACIEQVIDGKPTKHWLTMIWQEEWTSNPFAFTKYIKGKLVYQKDVEALEFYTKAYSIQNGTMTLSETEDPPFHAPVPGIEVKILA